jgi:hypothetical protein
MSTTALTTDAKTRANTLRTSSDTLRQLPTVTPQDVQPLCQEATAVATELEALADARDDFAAKLAECERKLLNVGRGLDANATNNTFEAVVDVGRLAFVLIPASLAFFVPANWSGRWAIGFGMSYVILIIAAVAIRSDSTYESKNRPLRKTALGDCAYQALPSYVAAVPVVAGIFLAVWLGFAALFLTYEPRADAGTYRTTPYASSFFALVTFEGPPETLGEGVKQLVYIEMTCGIVLIVGIFGLLVNRLSGYE